LLAVRGVVGRVQIDGDAAGAACSRLRWRAMTHPPAPRSCATVPGDPGHFQNATTWAARPDPHLNGSRPTNNLCTGSHARRAASLASHIPRPCHHPLRQQLFHFVQDLARLPLLAQTGSQRGSQTQPPVGRLSRSRRHRNCPGVDQTSQSRPLKILGRANTLLWYVRSSEGLTFGLKPAQTTVLYHGEAFVPLKS